VGRVAACFAFASTHTKLTTFIKCCVAIEPCSIPNSHKTEIPGIKPGLFVWWTIWEDVANYFNVDKISSILFASSTFLKVAVTYTWCFSST